MVGLGDGGMSDQEDAFKADKDQLQASIKTTAEMTGEMFKRLREENMTREEALGLTHTWLESLITRNKEGT